MNIFNKQTFFKILVSFILVFVVDNASGNSLCEQEFNKIANSTLFNTVDEALQAWAPFQKMCQKTGEYDLYLADIYLSWNDLIKSRKFAENVLKNHGKEKISREAEKILTIVDMDEGNIESAIERSKSLIKKYPKWYSGYFYYAVSLYMQGGDASEVKKYLEKANSLEETSSAYGWLAVIYYYEFKDFPNTLFFYKKALKLNRGEALLNREAAVAAIDSAMILNEWVLAQSLLNGMKMADDSIDDFPKYRKVKAQIDLYAKEKCLTTIKRP